LTSSWLRIPLSRLAGLRSVCLPACCSRLPVLAVRGGRRAHPAGIIFDVDIVPGLLLPMLNERGGGGNRIRPSDHDAAGRHGAEIVRSLLLSLLFSRLETPADSLVSVAVFPDPARPCSRP